MDSADEPEIVCADCEARYPEGKRDPPCPRCGSRRRTFLKPLNGYIKPEAAVKWLRTDKQERVLGYGDTGRHGPVRHGNLEQDDTISLVIEGRPPQNEEDTPRVCATLAAAMSTAEEHFSSTPSSDQDIDGVLTSETRTLNVQVVRAMSEMKFWRKLASTLRHSQQLSRAEVFSSASAAIAKKAAKLPARQRAQLILALDADRLPALALEPVVNEFRARYGAWTAAQGFQEIWLVGPDARLTWRLDMA